MKADELWEKYHLKLSADWQLSDDWCVVEKSDFLAALKEYGDYRAEETRKRAVRACRAEKLADPTNEPDDTAYDIAVEDCAAAIEKMELPGFEKQVDPNKWAFDRGLESF